MYKPIRRAELILGGTAIKQGEIFTLGFQLFDADGIVIIPEVGQTLSVKVANSTGVVLETVASVVSDHIEFTVAENIGAGKMRVELTVADGANVLQKYPASGYIELYISASLDDIGTGTIYTVTAAEMFTRIEGSEEASALAVQTAGEAVVIAEVAVETADAVRADFDLVVAEAGSSNPEVVLARGGEADLSTRLNGVDSQLAEKVDIEAARLKAIKLELEDASPTFLAAIEGGAGTSFDLLSVPQDGSVTPQKYSEAIINPAPPSDMLANMTFIPQLLSAANGVSYSSATDKTSEIFISVIPNTKYTFSLGVRIAFYTNNTTAGFISAVDNLGTQFNVPTTYTTPVNATFIRFSKGNAVIESVEMYQGDSIPNPLNYKNAKFFRVEKMAALPIESINTGNTDLTITNGVLTGYIEKIAGVTAKTGTLVYTNGLLTSITEVNSLTSLTQKTELTYSNGTLVNTATTFI